jgi:hypothetical protein
MDVVNVKLTDIFRENATGKAILAADGELLCYVTAVEWSADGYTKFWFNFNDRHHFCWRGGQISSLWELGRERGEYIRADEFTEAEDIWLPL